MTSLAPTQRMLPSLAAWLESPWLDSEFKPVRIEERSKDGSYVVRAELPGFDPENNISVTAQDGVLTISAERQESHSDNDRSEFSYGSFRRSIALPQGADTAKISATYQDGILEITMPHDTEPREKKVKIEVKK
ncbi:Hsp20/alpha crystallin family protein [Rhodococcus sp. X156]|uniref:Hsp20/alpha crystallin family protein n=1 Tax=Rhodococcus sp. X156 TaxID=2499145 RepID=UPI000FD6C254|nr:Hsp20/alpha crystallin family protein [Rhodococcus sp. X156]